MALAAPAIFAFAMLFASCRSLVPLSPADLTESGWNIHRGQAVWRPGRGPDEIAGDLLVAQHANGRAFIQFSKTPLPILVAQASTNQWQIHFSGKDRDYSGSGKPPANLPWFQLVRLIHGQSPQNPWTLTRFPDGRWRIEHRSTGEALEGFLDL